MTALQYFRSETAEEFQWMWHNCIVRFFTDLPESHMSFLITMVQIIIPHNEVWIFISYCWVNNCGCWLRKSQTNWQQLISTSHKLSQWLLVTVHRNHFWLILKKKHQTNFHTKLQYWLRVPPEISLQLFKNISDYEIETQFSYILNINRVQIQ